jgi:hypothetical protein
MARNIVVLRPPSGSSGELEAQLKGLGYRDSGGSQKRTIESLKEALACLNPSEPEVQQRALRFVANSAVFGETHGSIFSSSGFCWIVEALESPCMATRTLACTALVNLSLSGALYPCSLS